MLRADDGFLGVRESLSVIILLVRSALGCNRTSGIRVKLEVDATSVAGADRSDVELVVVVSKLGLTALHVLCNVKVAIAIIVIVTVVVLVLTAIGKSGVSITLRHAGIVVTVVVVAVTVILYSLASSFFLILLGLDVGFDEVAHLDHVFGSTTATSTFVGGRTELEGNEVLYAEGVSLLVLTSFGSLSTKCVDRVTAVELDGVLGHPGEILFGILVDATGLGEELRSDLGVSGYIGIRVDGGSGDS
mmetsp:Transcript_14852/g.21798  ORF Transcript_14852/g.21798 Transcript_14852/m.21798 type:complete len:246 (+) Transcript_14852:575-1312(+)